MFWLDNIQKKMSNQCHFIVPTLHILFDQFVNYVLQEYFSEFHLNFLKDAISSLHIADANAAHNRDCAAIA